MRILITSIVDLRRTSTNRLHHFVRHLVRNHSVTVLSLNDYWKAGHPGIELYTRDFADVLSQVDMRYLSNRKLSPILQELFSAFSLGRILEAMDYRSFHVHFNYNTLVSGYFVARRLERAGINTVYDMADDLPGMVGISPQIPSLLRPIARFVARQMLARSTGMAAEVTCITEELRQPYSGAASKWKLLPNGVDTRLFAPSTDKQARQMLGLGDAFVVGFVGGLREWVDFGPVFSAISRLNSKKQDIRMLIVGGEGRLEETRKLAREHRIADRVIFTGIVPYSQVPQYISGMDVCLIPFDSSSVSQGALPVKLFEYMACERPVITTRLKAIEETLQDKVLYASGSREYEARIAELISSPELRDKLGRAGRKLVEQHYDWAAIGAKLEQVLEQVARKHT